ncbi:MAG: helix-turn-helix domain-containing protein [Bacteroidales bacterium]|nr:helix-turn-helix domain-containing protein [Bacteroidales bacterium]
MLRYTYLLVLACCSLALAIHGQSVTYNDRSGLSHWIVSGIVQDRQGFIWLSTWNGLNRYDGYEFRQVKAVPGDGSHIRSEVIRKIDLDTDGNILCCIGDDMFMLDTKTYQFKDAPPDKHCKSIKQMTTLKDRQGNVWQLERYGVTKTPHHHYPAKMVAGTEKVQARAFLREKNGRWWLATKEDMSVRIFHRDNTLAGYLGRDGKLHPDKTTFGYRAYSMLEAANGDIWIGCKPGALLRLRPDGKGGYDIRRIEPAGLTCDIIYHIVQDRQERLWLGTFGDGIQCIPHPEADSPTAVNFLNAGFSKGKSRIRRLLLIGDNRLAGASTNGLYTADIRTDDIRQTVFRQLVRRGDDAGSLAGNATMDIVSDHRGNIFVATENYGIEQTTVESLFAECPRFTHHSKGTSSLTSDVCLALTVQPDGHLLVVSSDRVQEWNPETDEATIYATSFWNTNSHFSEERPLSLPDGSLLFGQEQGAYIATRHALTSHGYIPPLVFTELNIYGKPSDLSIAIRDTIRIDTDERNFSISYAALDYTNNTEICYRSKMKGGQWVNSGSKHELTFYDLQPGTYVLEVQSTDHYGRWADNRRQLVIIVTPHWYETLWARLLGWLLLIVTITVVICTLFYIRNLHHQRQKLLKKYLDLLGQSEERQATHSIQQRESLALEVPEVDQKFLERVRVYIEENISNEAANIADMAAHAAVSRSTLNRKLRSLVGITATQLLIDARLQKAHRLLSDPAGMVNSGITDVAYQCGYSDPRYFAKCFKQKYGITPTELYHQSLTASNPTADSAHTT